MSGTIIPAGYRSLLGVYETQKAIGTLKRLFEDHLSGALRLRRVSAPLFVDPASGLNDNLNGVERPVSFDIPGTGGVGEVVHSLAKWKRMALKRYGFSVGEGIYADMNAIRRDEEMDNLHSVYVDQWDWCRVIRREDRTSDFLRETVQTIVDAICAVNESMRAMFPALSFMPERQVQFITAQELEDLYPAISPKERENEYTKRYGTVFVQCIGGTLRSGQKHDGRAPDYDDWMLNGDLLFWDATLGQAIEISSMGIRVDEASLDIQLKASGCEDRRALPFHAAVLKGDMPLTIGGGIGQSRLCMLLLSKAHIGEVQASLWDRETQKRCEAAGIMLL